MQSESERRLLDAAVELFSDLGFQATRTREISSRAGLSPAAMYVHFPSKEDLLFRLVHDAHESTLRLLADAVTPHQDPVDRVHALVHAFSTVHAERYRTARIAQYESRHLTPEHHREVGRIRSRIRHTVRQEIDNGIAQGAFTIEDPRIGVLAIMSLGIDICRWYSPDGEFTAEELGSINADLVLQVLRADRTSRNRGIAVTSP